MNGYKTSISRTVPSAPLKALLGRGPNLIRKEDTVLDWGCGRGRDVEHLRSLGISAYGYDPNPALGFNDEPLGPFDVVLCTYVLNVLPREKEQEVLNQIRSKMTPFSIAYITVRRDLKTDTATQRNVVLDLPSLIRVNGRYEIYALEGFFSRGE